MKTKNDKILLWLQILSWVIFISLCIQAGGFIFNTLFVLLINPIGSRKFWTGINLSNLWAYNQFYFYFLTVLMIAVSLLKANLFYIIVKIFHDKKLDLNNPFKKSLGQYFFKISNLAFGIGFLSYLGVRFGKWLFQNGIEISSPENLQLGGADVWIMMGVSLFIFAQIFKKGLALQSENELTI